MQTLKKVRDYRKILDGTISIDYNSEKALKFKELCEDITNHPSDVIIKIYGSFEEMYKSGDIHIDLKKHFALQEKDTQ